MEKHLEQVDKKIQACRYLVINSGTSQFQEFTRQSDNLKTASVLFPARLR